MRLLFLFLVTIFVFYKANADTSKKPAKSKIDVLKFFETLVDPNPSAPANQRDPNWPDHLDFEPIAVTSISEIEEKLEGTWQTLYHCNGYPVFYDSKFGDGKINGYLQYTYQKNIATRSIINKSGLRQILNAIPYSISTQDEKFSLKYAYKYIPEINFFVKIKANGEDTGRIGLLSESGATDVYCPDGKTFVQVLHLKMNFELM